jgi:polysaccharide pyruvyl transferase WcaK-like protein
MLGIIEKMDLFIGMRMHSIVMASVMGVPAIGLSYDPKIEAAVQAAGQTFGGRVENLDIDRLLHSATELLMDRDAVSAALLERVDKLRTRSRKNMDILWELLENKTNE